MAAMGFLLFDKWEATIKVEIVGSKHRFDTEGLPKDRWSGVTSMSGKEMLIAEKSRRTSTQIADRESCVENPGGFTLIELLVVISVLVLLMAILLPTLGRVRKQAKAVACQANLCQWSLLFNMYLDDYDGRFWDSYPRHEWIRKFDQYRLAYSGFAMCPMATKRDIGNAAYASWAVPYDWQTVKTMSYGINGWLSSPGSNALHADHYWGTREVKGTTRIPVFFDCAWIEYTPVQPYDWPPPDRPPTEWHSADSQMRGICIDRHGEGINMLFLDWSVRWVGLKGLWTLKWSCKYDTAGPGTAAGGVQPEDWPPWMRKFKEY